MPHESAVQQGSLEKELKKVGVEYVFWGENSEPVATTHPVTRMAVLMRPACLDK
jgi:hypothetical protein